MRNYSDENKKGRGADLIKYTLSVLIPILMFFILLYLTAVLFRYTAIDEKFQPYFVIGITAIVSALMSILMTVFLRIKPIYCAIFAFVIIILLKLLLHLIFAQPIEFKFISIIKILYIPIFTVGGSILGAKIKN